MKRRGLTIDPRLAIGKHRKALLACYDFPAKHWYHIRTTNPIESTVATMPVRTAKTHGCVSRTSLLSMGSSLPGTLRVVA